jgi:hypothetical protein
MAPVIRALGGPFEFATLEHVPERPGGVVRNVGGDAKIATRAQDASDRCDV